MSISIVCPSGFAGEARRWKARDLTVLAAQLEKNDNILDGGMGVLLNGPWERTTNAGPYRHISEGDTKPDWNRILKGDILAALYQMRLGSFRDGDNYEFDFECSRERCQKETPWRVKLSTIVERKQELPAQSKANMLGGESMRTTLFDGTAVTFQLGTIDVEGDMATLRAQQLKRKEVRPKQAVLSDRIAAQVVAVGGELMDIRKRWKWAEALDADDLYDLLQAMDDADCGFDTEIEVRCDHCSATQRIDLPLGPSFLAPPRRQPEAAESQGAEKKAATTEQDQQPSPI